MSDERVVERIVDGHAVMAPEDYQDPKALYEKLISRVRKYHPSDDISMIEKAFEIAYTAHEVKVVLFIIPKAFIISSVSLSTSAPFSSMAKLISY